MAYQKPAKQPEFSDLVGILAQTKISHPAIYQTLKVLIDRLTQFRVVTIEEIADINNSINNSQSTINIAADKTATYLTKDPEELKLPNSRQLLAGLGVTLDYSIANRVTISAGGAAYYDSPLTDGNVDETELIFANGECIIVQVPG